MTDQRKNLLLGAILLGLGVVWTWLVWATVPPAFDPGTVGPRAFPLAFGVILIVLTVLLLLSSAAPSSEKIYLTRKIRWVQAAFLLAEICAYGFFLEKIGFLLATPLVVLIVMAVNLNIRKPKLLAGMALGLTVGCWLIFEKLMGIYLATGSWVNLG